MCASGTVPDVPSLGFELGPPVFPCFHLFFAPAPLARTGRIEAPETLPPSNFYHSVDSKSSPSSTSADFVLPTSFCSSSPTVPISSAIPHSLGRPLSDENFPPLSIIHPSLPNTKKVEGSDLIRVKPRDLSSKRQLLLEMSEPIQNSNMARFIHCNLASRASEVAPFQARVSDGMAPIERESPGPDSNLLLSASTILDHPVSLSVSITNSPVALPGIGPKNLSPVSILGARDSSSSPLRPSKRREGGGASPSCSGGGCSGFNSFPVQAGRIMEAIQILETVEIHS
ncbi:hypothetical protein Nepgr_028192 [Nepenthes gracilis]|uniref:Uncharacterized protein n=1 Tax=Nepenthes gracilis TaxID=150966 RepID=A0AAD3TBQ9_NEPGR|nr:hypothetical protein Nepgr_028192 [Nepenthes gracilis]